MINFNNTYVPKSALYHIADALREDKLCGDSKYISACKLLIRLQIKCGPVFITPSCTDALEMCALLIDTKPGDEIIMPSFTFTSTANAFMLFGGVPVFADIDRETCNINPLYIENLITEKTKAIVVVHYGGMPCAMHSINRIALGHNLRVIEDAAQAYMSKHFGSCVGTYSDLVTFSFHGTKNISCGEGGALAVNNENYLEKAQWIQDKGTNRRAVLSDNTDKLYNWVTTGSSYTINGVTAALLLSSLKEAKEITENRKNTWLAYRKSLAPFYDTQRGSIDETNGHIFAVFSKYRNDLIERLKKYGIQATKHYMPLHMTEFGQQFSKNILPDTEYVASHILRLPLWYGMREDEIRRVIDALLENTYE